MRIFMTIIVFMCCAFNSIFAQKDIKQIIYDDLLALNDMYNGCIINFKQEKWIIRDNDTIKQINTLTTLKDSSDSRVLIVEIDTIYPFYFVEVKFKLLANAPYSNLFSGNSFKYLLYKENDEYYKINGFLVSDILYVSNWIGRLKDSAKINAPNKFWSRYLLKRNVTKIQNYLSVSVLKEIKNLGFYICDKPYVKDIICH